MKFYAIEKSDGNWVLSARGGPYQNLNEVVEKWKHLGDFNAGIREFVQSDKTHERLINEWLNLKEEDSGMTVKIKTTDGDVHTFSYVEDIGYTKDGVTVVKDRWGESVFFPYANVIRVDKL